MTHEEYIREPSGATVAVLMVHGICGSPRHFDMLLDLVPEDYAVYAILLPGHGKIPEDFARSSLKKWEEKVHDTLTMLRERYEAVYLVGHSLGTLLLLDEIFLSGEKLKGAFLMAVPLTPQLAPTSMHAIPTALGFKPKENNAVGKVWRNAYSVAPDKNLFKYLTYAPRFIDLFYKIYKVRDGLKSYTGGDFPIMAVQSYYDELVMRNSIKPLRASPHIDTVMLRHSRHFYYPDGDLDILREEFRKIIECK